jgi:hypothetical protein
MTKLVVVLAVVVVVILVVVIVAVRNMRAEDPDEFAERPGRRGGMGDGRDPRYDRREPPARHPGRGSARGGRPAGRSAGGGNRPAGVSGRGFDERRDRRGRDYDQDVADGAGYDDDRRFDERPARGRDDRRGADGPRRRAEQGQPSARTRPARGRRSDDSSQWDSSEWEKLSDVDYWAELASDKPLTTTAQPAAPAAQARGGRSRPDRAAAQPAGRGAGPADSMPGVPVPGGAPRRDPATGLPVRGRAQPADGDLAAAGAGARRADFAPAPVPLNGATEQLHPLAEPRAASGRPSGPASLPRPVHSLQPERLQPDRVQQDRRPVDPDDDPLTSPSFPRVPASDSRSYRNGRASTPPHGSRSPEQYLAPTQEFSSYGSPAAPPAAPECYTGPQRAAAPRRQAAQHAADLGGENERTNPNAYRPDPMAGRADSYPSRSASVPPGPARPAPASNPYGSYVTPTSPPAVPGYGGYPPVPGHGHVNGNRSYLPPAGAPEADYWQQQQASGGYPAPDGPDYPNGYSRASDPRHAAPPADYGNGYGQHAQPGYPAGGHPASAPHDPAGYAGRDPYGPDEYGGYTGYGAAER